MNVLVVGSGGREHALVWKIAQSPRVKKIYCAPGNAGIGKIAECVALDVTDITGLADFAERESIDLTVVGPESSLVAGIVDLFEKRDLRIFGPNQRAAILEGSKVFTKKFMKKYAIPSAEYKVFRKKKKAKKYLHRCRMPVVIKADGLAAGKGVMVAETAAEAEKAVDLIMKEKAFGAAGDSVVIEEFLEGEEASFIAFTDGKTIIPLPSSQDHKAVFEGDKGPNTGGMGAYSPAPVVSKKIADYVMEKIMLPTIRGLAAEGRPYKGMLYAGLMIAGSRVQVLEFNCRFGDPEAQPLLMRLENDIVDIFEAVIDGTLERIQLKIDPRPAVCIVMASRGYPGAYQNGKQITGMTKAASVPDVEIFHAGTAILKRRLSTAGGRVLGVTALAKDLQTAIEKGYKVVADIDWDGCYFRKDIGEKAIRKMKKTTNKAMVGILMGSDSDLPVMGAAADVLKEMGVGYEMTVASAHRTPAKVEEFVKSAPEKGIQLIIAGAGMAAHLAGVIASHTDLPVIGVPLDASSLGGIDALLATVQMPPRIPVATMGIGKAGAKNAAILAVRILALHDDKLATRLAAYREKMIQEVYDKAKKVEG